MTHSLTWRQSAERIVMAREVLNSPGMAAMLAVLELDHPGKERVLAKIVNDGFGATLRLGQIDGFNQCLTMLKQLGEPAPLAPAAIQSTWGVNIEGTDSEVKK
jgi:hypothetical protein